MTKYNVGKIRGFGSKLVTQDLKKKIAVILLK